jgi:hypothetical protein
MGEFIVPLEVVGAIVVALVLAVAALVLRRHVITRGIGSFDCSLRVEDSAGRSRWMVGVARYEPDRLDWFNIFGFSLRPARSLGRAHLEILDRRPPNSHDIYAVMPGWVVARCVDGDTALELAMGQNAYNGFATWLESAPPGQGINVA